ncbi:MAG TPA: hypothetical protein VJ756_22705, partial [Terriglobales bacterium]|nr:hypothetical protein [Terriglobales bacterium]
IVGNCVVVSTNGRAHLELRRQEFAGRAMLTTYQSRLNKNELAILQRLLTADALKTLSPFIAPPTHLDSYQVSGWYDITAEIPRDASLQQIGYFEPTGEKRPIGTAEMRARWSRSSAAMHPLVEWFHAFRTDKRWMQISNPKSGVCGQEE